MEPGGNRQLQNRLQPLGVNPRPAAVPGGSLAGHAMTAPNGIFPWFARWLFTASLETPVEVCAGAADLFRGAGVATGSGQIRVARDCGWRRRALRMSRAEPQTRDDRACRQVIHDHLRGRPRTCIRPLGLNRPESPPVRAAEVSAIHSTTSRWYLALKSFAAQTYLHTSTQCLDPRKHDMLAIWIFRPVKPFSPPSSRNH